MKHGSEGGTVEPSFIMASMHLRIAYLKLSNLSVFHPCRIRGSIVSDYALWNCESCLTSRLKVIREKKVQCGRMIGGMGAIAPVLPRVANSTARTLSLAASDQISLFWESISGTRLVNTTQKM